MLVVYFILSLILLVCWINNENKESFLPPLRLDRPSLYPTTGPVDMLTMKKFLISDGYRFQNSLAPPEPINLHVDIKGEIGPRYQFPDNFRLRTGVFKERAFVEGFEGDTVAGTISQLNSRSEQDIYLLGHKYEEIEDANIRYDPWGKFAECAPTDRQKELNYPNGEFSWGDIINRFYTGPMASPDIVI